MRKGTRGRILVELATAEIVTGSETGVPGWAAWHDTVLQIFSTRVLTGGSVHITKF